MFPQLFKSQTHHRNKSKHTFFLNLFLSLFFVIMTHDDNRMAESSIDLQINEKISNTENDQSKCLICYL